MTSPGYLEGVRVCEELEQLGREEDLINCLVGLKAADQGQVKLEEQDFKAALDCSKKAENIFEKIPEAKYLLAICKADISASLGNLGDHGNAIIAAKECLVLVTGKRGHVFELTRGAASCNLGMSLTNIGKQEEAIFYFKKAREIYQNSPEHSQYLSVIDDNIEILQEELNGTTSGDDELKSPNQNCFIATAVYQGINSPEVIILRQFRDEKLSMSFFGKFLIKSYYSGLGQMVGKIISTRMNWVIPICRIFLDKIVLFILIKMD